MTHTEGELHFDFSAAQTVIKLDDPSQPRPQGWKLVDFVIEEADRLVLLEVKDPSTRPRVDNAANAAAQIKARQEFVRRLGNRALVTDELTPKARDSYCHLHLMQRDRLPMLYVFLLGAAELTLEPATLLALKESLRARLHQECAEPWSRPYVTDCLVLTETSWPKAFPRYTLRRGPDSAGDEKENEAD